MMRVRECVQQFIHVCVFRFDAHLRPAQTALFASTFFFCECVCVCCAHGSQRVKHTPDCCGFGLITGTYMSAEDSRRPDRSRIACTMHGMALIDIMRRLRSSYLIVRYVEVCTCKNIGIHVMLCLHVTALSDMKSREDGNKETKYNISGFGNIFNTITFI